MRERISFLSLNPFSRVLRWGYQRFGRHRFGVFAGYALFVLLALLLVMGATRWVVEPSLGRLATASGADPAEAIGAVRLNALMIVLGLSVLGFGILWKTFVSPIERFRRRMRARLADSTPEEMSVLAYWYERRSTQLEAVLADNEVHRQRLEGLEQDARRRKTALESLIAISGEALILVDPEGRIEHLSQAACQLSGWHRLEAQGKPFTEAFPLYDDSRENPREFPLQTLTQRIIDSGSSLPRIENALLIDRKQQPVKLLVTGAALLETDHAATGALFRLERLGTAGVVALGTGELRTTTTRDPISGLLPREAFERRLDELLQQSRADGTRHALVLVLHESLGRVGERFGFEASEQVVWRSAQVLQEMVASRGDCFALSTDRSALLLPLTGEADAEALAEGIRKVISGREFLWDEQRFTCTVSLAVLELSLEAEGRQQLLQLANQLLLRAQKAGGNQVLTLALNEAVFAERRSDLEWVTWLETRLRSGYGHLISQVIQPLEDKSAKPNLEIYVRIEDEDGTWVSAGAFMPALERHNRTALLDLWVVDHLLSHLENHLDLLDAHQLFTVNLSASSLQEADFLPQLVELFAGSSVAAERICFEVEERAAATYALQLQKFLREIQPLGVKVALDQSRSALGLELLRDVGIDYVKIHEGVIKRAMTNAIDRAQLDWIIRSALLLSRDVVACGIESAETLNALRGSGVRYVQGIAINKFGPIMT